MSPSLVQKQSLSPLHLHLPYIANNSFNAEVREDVLHDMLQLPPWLHVQRAFTTTVHCKVSWTKLTSQPIRIVSCVDFRLL